jgi:hypothetical protein
MRRRLSDRLHAKEASHGAGSLSSGYVAVILPNRVNYLLQLIWSRVLVELESQ